MKHVVTTLLLFLLASTASAQITIDAIELRQAFIGQELNQVSYEADSTADLSALEAATGPDQTYDFASIPYGDTLSVSYSVTPVTAATPGVTLFPGANFVLTSFEVQEFEELLDTLEVFVFFELSDQGSFSHGFFSMVDFDEDGDQDTLVSRFDPPSLDWPASATFGTTWTDSTTLQIELRGSDFPFPFPASTQITEHEVDGWGTLVTPNGAGTAELPALRVRQVTRSQSAIPGLPDTETENIMFVTENGAVTGDVSPATQAFPASGSLSILVGGTPGGGGGGGDPTPNADDRLDVPVDARLDQNYPNPFNPATQIPFELASSGPVTLTVYDALGREVDVLVSATLPAGAHQVEWASGNLPSGIYLYELKAGGQSLTRTMMLMK